MPVCREAGAGRALARLCVRAAQPPLWLPSPCSAAGLALAQGEDLDQGAEQVLRTGQRRQGPMSGLKIWDRAHAAPAARAPRMPGGGFVAQHPPGHAPRTGGAARLVRPPRNGAARGRDTDTRSRRGKNVPLPRAAAAQAPGSKPGPARAQGPLLIGPLCRALPLARMASWHLGPPRDRGCRAAQAWLRAPRLALRGPGRPAKPLRAAHLLVWLSRQTCHFACRPQQAAAAGGISSLRVAAGAPWRPVG